MKPDLLLTALLFAVFIFGMVAGAELSKPKSCTITIKDMQGVQHQIQGVCDEQTN